MPVSFAIRWLLFNNQFGRNERNEPYNKTLLGASTSIEKPRRQR